MLYVMSGAGVPAGGTLVAQGLIVFEGPPQELRDRYLYSIADEQNVPEGDVVISLAEARAARASIAFAGEISDDFDEAVDRGMVVARLDREVLGLLHEKILAFYATSDDPITTAQAMSLWAESLNGATAGSVYAVLYGLPERGGIINNDLIGVIENTINRLLFATGRE